MGTPEKNSQTILPKINRILAYRTLALIVGVGSLAVGLMWFLKVRSDLGGLIKSDTAGWISAIEYLPQGQQVVLISPDGKVHKDPGHTANSIDRDATWSPKGNFLYFASDRVDHNFNVFRWSPSSEKESEQRTIGTPRSRGNLRFPAQPIEEPDNIAKALLTTGGVVQEFDPATSATVQVLPPTSKEITQAKSGDESGTAGQFEGAYGTLGTSFREGQWCGNQRYICAVMRREAGEVLVIQDMQRAEGKLPPPKVLIAGEHVEFAINPKDGNIVYCVQGFQWPDGKPPEPKDGKKITKPFINGLGIFAFEGNPVILGASKGDIVFTSPAISPDGKAIAIVVGKMEKGELQIAGLATYPTSNDPTFKPLQYRGDVHEPSWSIDSQHILAALRMPNKPRSIYEFAMDGTAPRNVTGDTGNYGFPHYSPQQKGASSS